MRSLMKEKRRGNTLIGRGGDWVGGGDAGGQTCNLMGGKFFKSSEKISPCRKEERRRCDVMGIYSLLVGDKVKGGGGFHCINYIIKSKKE